MISIYEVVGFNSKYLLKLVGLSSDEKPIKKFDSQLLMNGSRFLEMDTNNEFIYDEAAQKWLPFSSTSGGGSNGSSSGGSDTDSDDVIYDGGGVAG